MKNCDAMMELLTRHRQWRLDRLKAFVPALEVASRQRSPSKTCDLVVRSRWILSTDGRGDTPGGDVVYVARDAYFR